MFLLLSLLLSLLHLQTALWRRYGSRPSSRQQHW
jgi:hypothetical protein